MNKAKIKPQSDVEDIFKNPGYNWSKDDRKFVIKWLCQDPQFKYLSRFVREKLGDGTQPEDAEDVLQDFIARTEILKKIIENYDPTRDRASSFWNYLLKCLEYQCYENGGKIRIRHQTEISLTILNDEEKEFIEFELEDPAATSEEDLMYKVLVEEIKMSKVLSDLEKMVLALFYIDGLKIKEIAEKLSISIPYVKVLLCNARKKLNRSYRKKDDEYANTKG